MATPSADNIMACWQIPVTYTPDAGNPSYPTKTANFHFRCSETTIGGVTPAQRVRNMTEAQVGSKMLSISGMSPSVVYGTATKTTDQSWSVS